MEINETTQTVILLSTPFFKTEEHTTKIPFYDIEHLTVLKEWLEDGGHTLKDLLCDEKLQEAVSYCFVEYTSAKGIHELLKRGVGLAFAVEKWIRCGITIVTCFDELFNSFTDKGVTDISPVLFYGGDIEIVHNPHTIVLHSTELHDYLLKLDKITDYSVTLSPPILGKTDCLIEKSCTKLYRQYILSGNLLLVSTTNPSFKENDIG